jgi:hypothetical protein
MTIASVTPSTMPPATAPGMFPIPPSTAATKAFSPGIKPMSGSTFCTFTASRIPAAAASAEPSANVKVMMPFTFTPMRRAAS